MVIFLTKFTPADRAVRTAYAFPYLIMNSSWQFQSAFRCGWTNRWRKLSMCCQENVNRKAQEISRHSHNINLSSMVNMIVDEWPNIFILTNHIRFLSFPFCSGAPLYTRYVHLLTIHVKRVPLKIIKTLFLQRPLTSDELMVPSGTGKLCSTTAEAIRLTRRITWSQ